jgi:hypothetical protein
LLRKRATFASQRAATSIRTLRTLTAATIVDANCLAIRKTKEESVFWQEKATSERQSHRKEKEETTRS